MGKRDLKKQYENLDVSLIDLISRLDKTKTKKVTPFLLKMASNSITRREYSRYQFDGKITCNSWLESVLCDVASDILGHGNIDVVDEFIEHLENNRIERNDINQYDSWDDLISEKNIADFKLMDKEATKQVIKVYEDEEWLVVKPLSLKASLAYGSSTKWCTASKNNPDYFYRYSNEGILIYILNKKNGKKFGFYHGEHELSFWNQIDHRIDSMETDIPINILMIIKENSDRNKYSNNIEYFSEEEYQNFMFYRAPEKISRNYANDNYEVEVNEEPISLPRLEYFGTIADEGYDNYENTEEMPLEYYPDEVISDIEVGYEMEALGQDYVYVNRER
jgi:hypothetical protein